MACFSENQECEVESRTNPPQAAMPNISIWPAAVNSRPNPKSAPILSKKILDLKSALEQPKFAYVQHATRYRQTLYRKFSQLAVH